MADARTELTELVAGELSQPAPAPSIQLCGWPLLWKVLRSRDLH